MEKVECYKYLGSHVAKGGCVKMEVRYRVNEGCKALRVLNGVIKCRILGVEAVERKS